MSVRSQILDQFKYVAHEQDMRLGPLYDELPLLDLQIHVGQCANFLRTDAVLPRKTASFYEGRGCVQGELKPNRTLKMSFIKHSRTMKSCPITTGLEARADCRFRKSNYTVQRNERLTATFPVPLVSPASTGTDRRIRRPPDPCRSAASAVS